jgi:hypothetical protein
MQQIKMDIHYYRKSEPFSGLSHSRHFRFARLQLRSLSPTARGGERTWHTRVLKGRVQAGAWRVGAPLPAGDANRKRNMKGGGCGGGGKSGKNDKALQEIKAHRLNQSSGYLADHRAYLRGSHVVCQGLRSGMRYYVPDCRRLITPLIVSTRVYVRVCARAWRRGGRMFATPRTCTNCVRQSDDVLVVEHVLESLMALFILMPRTGERKEWVNVDVDRGWSERAEDFMHDNLLRHAYLSRRPTPLLPCTQITSQINARPVAHRAMLRDKKDAQPERRTISSDMVFDSRMQGI